MEGQVIVEKILEVGEQRSIVKTFVVMEGYKKVGWYMNPIHAPTVDPFQCPRPPPQDPQDPSDRKSPQGRPLQVIFLAT
jgi:hypothetical protein